MRKVLRETAVEIKGCVKKGYGRERADRRGRSR